MEKVHEWFKKVSTVHTMLSLSGCYDSLTYKSFVIEYLTLPGTSITFYICMKYGFNSTPRFHTAQEVLLATIEAEGRN